MTQVVFEGLVGAQIAEIRDFYDGGNKEEWLGNFREKLGKIKDLIDSEEAAGIYNGSILESARLAAENMEKNLNNLAPDKLSKEVKEALLKSLDNLFG